MKPYAFRIVNVFGLPHGDRFSGNALCVFEDATGLTDEQMQALARQFNLSETTFVLPPRSPTSLAGVRIFTPSFEMPFAGHPTLGTAHVVSERLIGDGPQRILLDMIAGRVEVHGRRGDSTQGDWTLRAAYEPRLNKPRSSLTDLADMLSVPAAAIVSPPQWVDTGVDQLIVPLARADDVRRARPDAGALAVHGFSERAKASMVYIWAPTDEGQIISRFFFLSQGALLEDPATGSACANLGGFLLAGGETAPFERTVHQGLEVSRPSLLELRVDAERRIYVSGHVVEVARGHAFVS